jgi:hypothetical protein
VIAREGRQGPMVDFRHRVKVPVLAHSGSPSRKVDSPVGCAGRPGLGSGESLRRRCPLKRSGSLPGKRRIAGVYVTGPAWMPQRGAHAEWSSWGIAFF